MISRKDSSPNMPKKVDPLNKKNYTAIHGGAVRI
jgi:hypothetical protein